MDPGWSESGMPGKLGVAKRVANLASVAGMRYPMPEWFLKKPPTWRLAWRFFFTAVEISFCFTIMSNVVLLIKEGKNSIGVATECFGSLLYFSFGIFKSQYLYKKREVLDRVMKRIHALGDKFYDNPMGNKGYLREHNKQCRLLQMYIEGKVYALMVAIVFVVLNQLVPGLMHPSSDSQTPMLGWYPLDYNSRIQFLIISLMQWLHYSLIGLRDLFADLTLLLVLAAVNVQLIFARELLIEIVESKRKDHSRLVTYWVTLHQEILNILEDLKEITGPCLFATYANVSIFFFLLLVRLTEDKDFAVMQQGAIIGMTISNLVNLCIISVIGDRLATNSMAAADAAESPALWDLKRDQQRSVLQVAVRCNRPSYIVFGDNRKLCVSSFGDIVTALFSYFNTIYSLRV